MSTTQKNPTCEPTPDDDDSKDAKGRMDPPSMPRPVCQRCGEKSILGYLRYLNPYCCASHDYLAGENFCVTFWGTDTLGSYGGCAVYLARYANANEKSGLSFGCYDVLACGNCWRELLKKMKIL